MPQALQSINGSDPEGGCINKVSLNTSSGLDSSGVCLLLINGAKSSLVDRQSPPLDLANSTWARGLVTLRQLSSNDSVQIGFDFGTNVSLSAITLDLFNCPAWGIGPAAISAFTIPGFRVYPEFDTNVAERIGSLNSASIPSSCNTTVQMCLPVASEGRHRYYHVGFDFPSRSAAVGGEEGGGAWVAIAEVGFYTAPPPAPQPPPEGTVVKSCRSRATR